MKPTKPIPIAYSDDDYLEGLLNNTDATLSKMYKQFFPPIQNLILSNSGSEDDAKDIFQETLIILYNKLKKGDFKLTSQLKTYLFAIAKRLWLKKLQEFGKRDFNFDIEKQEILAVEEDISYFQAKEKHFLIMEESLEQLGEPCKTILEDFYLKELSMQEICEKFGYTNAENAKNQKYKCLQRLKKMFFSK